MLSILRALPGRGAFPSRWLRRAGCIAATTLVAGCSSLAPIPDGPDAAAAVSGADTAALPARPDHVDPAPVSAAQPAAQPPNEDDTDVALVSPAPVVPAHDDLWQRIRAGFALPELDTPLVAAKERFYLQRPEYLQRMFQRGNRYLYHIVEEIERRGMPTELALLPFVESAMNPVALSSAQAAGLWQFIPSTGRAYNLEQDWWVDNRRDVVRSTEAALDYLQKIYALAGNDWFLALASYNWGENAVARAMRRNEARGKPTDYLSLSMPAETRNYVPKLLALKNIVLHAADLGVALPALPNEAYFVTIEKTRPIDLKLAAQFAGMTVAEFVALNPAHNRPVIAASRNNQIKLPADRLDAFLAAVEVHGKAKRAFATWQPHTIQPGETIESIARRAGITAAELLDANDLRASRRILAGTRILAPQRTVADETRLERFEGPRVYELVEQPAAWHRVRRGETLASVARRYGTTVARLRAWNRVGPKVRTGTLLKVRPATTQTVLTTENGDRRIVRHDDEPKIVHAVLRREAPVADEIGAAAAAPAARPTTPARTKRARAPATKTAPAAKSRQAARSTHTARPASKKAPRPAAKARPVAKANATGTARSAKVRTTPPAAPARRADKRT